MNQLQQQPITEMDIVSVLGLQGINDPNLALMQLNAMYANMVAGAPMGGMGMPGRHC